MSIDNSSSTSLFSSLLDSTIKPNPDLSPPHPHPHPQPLLNSLDDRTWMLLDDDDIDSSPPLFSTPKLNGPQTQEFLDRLLRLRHVEVADDAASPAHAMQREIEDLKSELVAARMQLEENEVEMRVLRQQMQAQQLGPLPPPPPEYADGYKFAISKKKKKKKKKREQMEAALTAAEPTLPPGCTSIRHLPPPSSSSPNTTLPPGSIPIQLPPPTSCPPPHPRLLPPPPQLLPTAHVFHDSNLKHVTPDEISKSLKIVAGQTNSPPHYHIMPHETFTLPQTLNTIKRTTFKSTDIIIINTLTNDARQTKHRHARSPQQTKHTQTTIINYLKTLVPAHNIVILESPPLLETPTSDIFPYNLNSYLLSRHLGTRFSETLVGESHLFKDGYHILRSSRQLLVKSVAAAIANVRPHQRFNLPRPPHGIYGPWAAPSDVGMLPSTYGSAALSRPISFRRAGIPSLMDINI